MLNSYLTEESMVYSSLKVLLPPQIGQQRTEMKAAYDKLEFGKKNISLDLTKDHVKNTWKVNATLFVSIYCSPTIM